MKGWWFSPDLVLGLFNELYVPRQPDWPCPIQMVGHTVWDPPGDPAMESRLQEFLHSGSPPVCFVPGSVGPGSSHYYEVAVDICRQLDLRGIILDKAEHEIAKKLPPFMKHASYVPLRNVLSKCRAIVHSGCIGTTAQGFLAGIPHLVRPRVNDQPDMAQRITRIGVGLAVNPQDFHSSRVVPLLRRLLHEPRFQERCQSVQQVVKCDDAAKSIANALEKLLPTLRP